MGVSRIKGLLLLSLDVVVAVESFSSFFNFIPVSMLTCLDMGVSHPHRRFLLFVCLLACNLFSRGIT